MAGEKRVDPETGEIQEFKDNLIVPGGQWKAIPNENGRDERINPDDGVLEERHENLIFPGDTWKPKRD